jgi:peptide-methionine (S)-S-oxide reductase
MSELKQDFPTGRLAAGAAAVLAALTMAALMVLGTSRAAEPAVAIPPPAEDSPKAAGPTQTAVLAGGCFWGVQGVFEHLTGVKRVLAGYAGGDRTSAHYEIVGAGGTGHAESVQIVYDPQQVTYGQILQVFFSVAHDPTELNRQGPDTGSQYRSSIFYANEAQQKIAQAYIEQLNQAGVYRAPIVTRVDPLKGFYVAEGYHQDFLLRNPSNSYIVVNDLPKIENFRKVLPSLYAASPAKLSPGAW